MKIFILCFFLLFFTSSANSMFINGNTKLDIFNNSFDSGFMITMITNDIADVRVMPEQTYDDVDWYLCEYNNDSVSYMSLFQDININIMNKYKDSMFYFTNGVYDFTSLNISLIPIDSETPID